MFPQRFGSSIRGIRSTNWRDMSKFHYLSDEEIECAVSAGAESLRACLLDSTTHYLVLTIPESSCYRSVQLLTELLGKLTLLKLIPRFYKAAGCDDIQLFLSFSEPVKTEEMSKSLGEYLEECGFHQALGQLTIHTGETFSIPLQPGFYWLNHSFEPKLNRDEISLSAAIAFFLRDLETAAVCPAAVQESLRSAKKQGHRLYEEKSQVEMVCEPGDCEPILVEEISDGLRGLVAVDELDLLHLLSPAVGLDTDLSLSSSFDSIGLCSRAVEFSDDTVGMQLLLFPADTTQQISSLPKGRPKRGKRARSNLPDSTKAVTPD